MSVRIKVLAAVMAGALLTTSGCAVSAPAAATAAAPPGAVSGLPASGAPKAAAEVPATLAFTGKTLDGAPFDAASLAGKPTLLWFWAPWCATCAGQASSITDLKDEYGDKLAIVGIAGMGKNKEMHEFVSDLDVGTVPNLDDEAGVLWKRFGITEQSWFVLIDRSGKKLHTGWLDDVDLTAQVKSLVA